MAEKYITKNCKLTRLNSVNNNLRTNEIVGFCVDLPVVGSSFFMYSEGLETAGVRVVQTSVIKEMTTSGFKTENSEYQLELLPMS